MQEPLPVTLAGPHVRLEPLDRAHLDDLAEVCEPDFYRWMPAGPFGPGGFEAWLGRAPDARDAGRELPFALVLNETGAASAPPASATSRRATSGWRSAGRGSPGPTSARSRTRR